MLVDIHPEPALQAIEALRQGRRVMLGRAAERPTIAKVLATRAALEAALAGGAFVLERSLSFDFLYYFVDLDGVRRFLTTFESARAFDEGLVERAGALPGVEGFVLRERVSAARLRRVDGASPAPVSSGAEG